MDFNKINFHISLFDCSDAIDLFASEDLAQEIDLHFAEHSDKIVIKTDVQLYVISTKQIDLPQTPLLNISASVSINTTDIVRTGKQYAEIHLMLSQVMLGFISFTFRQKYYNTKRLIHNIQIPTARSIYDSIKKNVPELCDLPFDENGSYKG